MSFCTALSMTSVVPFGVLYEILHLRTLLSLLRIASMIKPIFQTPRIALLSSIRTTSPFRTLRLSVCHFGWITRDGKISRTHFFQKHLTTFSMKSRRYLSEHLSLNGHWGIGNCLPLVLMDCAQSVVDSLAEQLQTWLFAVH